MITLNTSRILVPIDFSETSKRAIKHAASVAGVSKGELILLHVQKKRDLVDILMPAFKMKDLSQIELFLTDKLEKLAEQVRSEFGLPVKTILSLGGVASEIVQIAEDKKAGLIVMGTQGSDSTNDVFLGSNAYRVLTKSTIPVMTVRSAAPKAGYANILLPIDSSNHSRQKVNFAVQIADKFKARLFAVGLLGTHERNYEYKLKVILPQIRKMAQEKKLECSTEIEQTVNRADKTILYAKKIKADLIIIMTDQRAEFSSLILGTYAHQLINNSKIPILSIPPEIHPENMEQDSIGGMW
jgi:nucleotide-binding universal stress UspA family protein